jgi:hypothetical protein
MESTSFTGNLIKYSYAIICIVICTIVILVAYSDRKATTDSLYYYLFFLIVPLSVAMYSLVPIFQGGVSAININTLYALAGVGIAIGFGAVLFKSMQSTFMGSVSKYIVWTTLAFLILIGASLVYKIFVRTIENVPGWNGFFLKLVFYIPCLFIEFIEYLLGEFRTTPNVVYVLFMLEILLFLVYIYLPKAISGAYNKYTNRLLNKPVFLNKRIVVGDANTFEYTDPGNQKLKNKNYTIDAWIYINPRANNNQGYKTETPILRYGTPFAKFGKPALYYSNQNGKMDNYIFYLSDKVDKNTNEVPKFELQIPGQRWNHIAITYLDNNVDIFVNGILQKSMPLNLAFPSYNVSDVIEIGKDDSGLSGAICNVSYHKIPLSSQEISRAYNINMYNNPPI